MDKKLRVLSIFGTRPEAVKMAPVVRALTQEPAIESRVCVTAQHREMLDQVLDLFSIKPDIDLNLMKPKQSLTRLTSQILDHLEACTSEREAGLGARSGRYHHGHGSHPGEFLPGNSCGAR